jgi:uncharacterized phage protein (TIGR01671 family)
MGGGDVPCKIEDCDLMQYTGRKDKNGAEICSGDICVNKSSRRCICIYNEKAACFDFKPINGKGDSVGFSPQAWHTSIEIIGNINENPELLED